MLEEEMQHRLGADERHVRDRHSPAQVPRGPHERAATLIGAGAQHRLDAGLAKRLHGRSHVVLELGAADIGGLGGDPHSAVREPAGDAVGTAAAVGVDLVVDAEPTYARLPEALDERHHLLPVRGPDVEDLLEIGLLALRLGAREVADQDHLAVGIALDHRERARERRRADVVREKEDLLLLDELDRVLDARSRLVPVVERDDRDRAAVHTAALIDFAVVGQRAAIELDPEARRGPLEGGAHTDPNVLGAHAGAGAPRIDAAPGGRLAPRRTVPARTPPTAAAESTLSTVRRFIVIPPPAALLSAPAEAVPDRAGVRAARRRAETRGPTARGAAGSTRRASRCRRTPRG